MSLYRWNMNQFSLCTHYSKSPFGTAKHQAMDNKKKTQNQAENANWPHFVVEESLYFS